MQKRAQEEWQQDLAYAISKLKEIEEWIVSEEDPEIQAEMIENFRYLLNTQISEAIKLSFGW